MMKLTVAAFHSHLEPTVEFHFVWQLITFMAKVYANYTF